MAEKKHRKLTVKEKKLVRGVLAGKGQRRAAIDAGYSAKSADAIASETLNKPKIKAALAAAYERAEITDDYLAKKAKELMEAKSPISYMGIQTGEEPNWHARARGLDIAHKVRKDYDENNAAQEVRVKFVFGSEGGE